MGHLVFLQDTIGLHAFLFCTNRYYNSWIEAEELKESTSDRTETSSDNTNTKSENKNKKTDEDVLLKINEIKEPSAWVSAKNASELSWCDSEGGHQTSKDISTSSSLTSNGKSSFYGKVGGLWSKPDKMESSEGVLFTMDTTASQFGDALDSEVDDA